MNIGKTILSNLFRFYRKRKLDDAEYVPVAKVIIEGITEAMTEAGFAKKDVKRAEKDLRVFNRDLYVDLWLKHAKEDLGEKDVDIDAEIEDATYYFDYIYKHGEHPR
jgi:hypothetical protein